MNKFVLSIIAAFALCIAAAAQGGSYPAGSQGTQQSSPSTQQGPAGNSQPGMGQSGSPQMGQPDQNSNSTMSDHGKGEKKLKGCVQAQGGQAMLETKKGKEVALSGQDLSAHNGHEVEVKGMWAEGASAGTQTSSGAGASGEKTFNVTDVKMISETCKGSGKSSGSGMGSSSSGSNSTGSSTGTGSSSDTKPQ